MSTRRQRTSNDSVHYSREHYPKSWSVHELIIKLQWSVQELGVRKMSQHVDRGLVMTVFITLVNIIIGAGLFTSLLLNYISLLRSWEFGRGLHM